jgi:rhodanese-related sulfurtransferase
MAVKNVTVKEAHQKQSEGYTYVDVRSVPEFEAGHPAGATNVPLLNRDPRSGQMTPNPEFLDVMRASFPADAKLLIGCQVGGRSAQAAQILAGSGFSDVSNVLGGYGGARDQTTGGTLHEGWSQAGLPIETDAPGRTYADVRTRAKGNR